MKFSQILTMIKRYVSKAERMQGGSKGHGKGHSHDPKRRGGKRRP